MVVHKTCAMRRVQLDQKRPLLGLRRGSCLQGIDWRRLPVGRMVGYFRHHTRHQTRAHCPSRASVGEKPFCCAARSAEKAEGGKELACIERSRVLHWRIVLCDDVRGSRAPHSERCEEARGVRAPFASTRKGNCTLVYQRSRGNAPEEG